MPKFSANLGFLWTQLPLPDAIYAAKSAGFDAVECHWPYDVDPTLVKAALAETGLPMLGLNTRRGNLDSGDNGLCALPDRKAEARETIDQAVSYAAAVGARNVHVMAGFSSGVEAHETFVANLIYACDVAAAHNITILIEPLNSYDAPGYFLTTTTQAASIIDAVEKTNLKLMFDCYHVQLMEGDLSHRLHDLFSYVGHIQFASVPDRGPPDEGEINYRYIFALLDKMGYAAPLGAEYKPHGDTEHSLAWLRAERR